MDKRFENQFTEEQAKYISTLDINNQEVLPLVISITMYL